MMENKNENFLEIYKSLEKVLREQYKGSVLDYENMLPQDEMEKLRICRQMRNYIQHHDDGNDFLVCSRQMCDFIAGLIRRERDNSISDHILFLKPVLSTEKLADVRSILMKSKRNWLPVVNGDGKFLGTIDIPQLVRITSRNGNHVKLSSALPLAFLKESGIPAITEEQVDDFEENNAVIINSSGGYIGILK